MSPSDFPPTPGTPFGFLGIAGSFLGVNWRQIGKACFPLAFPEPGLSLSFQIRENRQSKCPDFPKSIKTDGEEERKRVSMRDNKGEEGKGGIIHTITSESERA